MDGLGGRKLLAFGFVFIIACLMLWFGKLDGGQWQATVTWVFAAFAAGNGLEHVGKGLQRG